MNKIRPLDAVTIDRVQTLLTEARRNGISPVDALARSPFLLDPQRRRDIEIVALRDLVNDLTRWRPVEYARRHSKTDPQSPAQMLEIILEYIDEYIAMKAAQR